MSHKDSDWRVWNCCTNYGTWQVAVLMTAVCTKLFSTPLTEPLIFKRRYQIIRRSSSVNALSRTDSYLLRQLSLLQDCRHGVDSCLREPAVSNTFLVVGNSLALSARLLCGMPRINIRRYIGTNQIVNTTHVSTLQRCGSRLIQAFRLLSKFCNAQLA